MRNILALLALSSVACGGSVVSENGPANRDSKIEGSYELKFGHVTVTASSTWPGSAEPPSTGSTVRLDIAKRGSGYEASITPAYGVPSKFFVAVGDDELTLTGDGVAISAANATDHWKTIVLPREAGGSLAGGATLQGDEDVFSGDVGWSGTIAGTAALAADTHPPELRSHTASPMGPADALLPWDAVVVETSEPVSREALTKDLQPGAPIAWSTADADSSWAGVTSIIGRATSFDVTSVPLTLAHPLVDSAGNAQSSFAATLKFLPVAAPRAEYDFESKVASWNATFVSAPSLGCTGTCAKVGPLAMSACGANRGGLAVRTPGASSIAVRYRMVVESFGGGSPETPSIYGNVLSIDVATPGNAAVTTSVAWNPASLKKLDGSTAMATDWSTVSAPGETSAKELGVTVRAGDRAFDGFCDGFAPAAAQVTFYVDSIVAK